MAKFRGLFKSGFILLSWNSNSYCIGFSSKSKRYWPLDWNFGRLYRTSNVAFPHNMLHKLAKTGAVQIRLNYAFHFFVFAFKCLRCNVLIKIIYIYMYIKYFQVLNGAGNEDKGEDFEDND